ncbi:MAG: ATP-binding cassette domain-containing protein [Rhizobiales bacterium]|nr:ATP-binding cassette domain-containing protein [Hyphomicrobiales bacterium]
MANLLEVRNLRAGFALHGATVPVVEGIDLDVRKSEVLGIIGESGSGKTVTFLSLLRLLPRHANVEADSILFDGRETRSLTDGEFRALRGTRIAMIFQDPVGSFNPVKSIGWHFQQVAARAAVGRNASLPANWREAAIELLATVGIPHGKAILSSYPHQLSGGMLQRALIALVLGLGPSLIVADEPTTNLDNIVEHQIIELFRGLKESTRASFVFITHDMTVAARLCDRIAVMYAGQIVERGSAAEILGAPRHPYTQGLVRTANELQRRVARLIEIPGELPNWRTMPAGCRFRARCPLAGPECEHAQRLLTASDGHEVRCVKSGSPR